MIFSLISLLCVNDGHCDTRIYALKARWTWSESGFVHGSLVRAAALYLSTLSRSYMSSHYILNFDLEREIL